jgi:hypothetical protein
MDVAEKHRRFSTFWHCHEISELHSARALRFTPQIS